MKTYKRYAFVGLNLFCLIFAAISFISLQKSIQIEREKLNNRGYEVFVSKAILPSTPRIIKVPKASVKKQKYTKPVVNTMDTSDRKVLATYTGNISYYASDCKGCSGITASGYNIKSGNIYYQDATYGTVHIVAGDASFPFGSIIRTKIGGNSIVAIVLDRGGIGFGRKYLFDMLCESEAQAYQLGVIKNATIEILRYGY